MSGETILKSSIFGGYKKEEVNQYVDSVVEANEKRIKELQEKMAYLEKENNQLKNQLDVEEKIRPKISDNSDRLEYHHAHENRQPAQFISADLNGSKNREKMPIRQQMELSEGIYIVSKDQSIVSLPKPLPVYRTKEKSIGTTSGNMENAVHGSLEEAGTLHENVSFEAEAEKTEKNKISGNGSMGELTNTADVNGTETAEDARKISKNGYIPLRQNKTLSEYSDKQYAHETELSPLKSHLPEHITEIQNELLSVKTLLEKEKRENQLLAAKLEFSNDLLIQLYRK